MAQTARKNDQNPKNFLLKKCYPKIEKNFLRSRQKLIKTSWNSKKMFWIQEKLSLRQQSNNYEPEINKKCLEKSGEKNFKKKNLRAKKIAQKIIFPKKLFVEIFGKLHKFCQYFALSSVQFVRQIYFNSQLLYFSTKINFQNIFRFWKNIVAMASCLIVKVTPSSCLCWETWMLKECSSQFNPRTTSSFHWPLSKRGFNCVRRELNR